MMTKNIKHIFCAGIALFSMAAALVACGDKEAPIEDLQPAICPATIEFNLPDNLQQLVYTDETGARVLPLIKGEHISLPFTMTPDDIISCR